MRLCVYGRRHGSGIAIDDITFHRCVRLGQFDQDRTISFIPPDGEFELMKYRITQNVNLPFRVIPLVVEHGSARVEYEVRNRVLCCGWNIASVVHEWTNFDWMSSSDVQIKIKGSFSANLFATNVVLKIPTPKNTAKVKLAVTAGKAKYKPETGGIVWKYVSCVWVRV